MDSLFVQFGAHLQENQPERMKVVSAVALLTATLAGVLQGDLRTKRFSSTCVCTDVDVAEDETGE